MEEKEKKYVSKVWKRKKTKEKRVYERLNEMERIKYKR